MEEKKFKIEGMMCEGCENRVKNVLGLIDGVTVVSADHSTGEVCVKSNKPIDMKIIKEKIEDLDYKFVG